MFEGGGFYFRGSIFSVSSFRYFGNSGLGIQDFLSALGALNFWNIEPWRKQQPDTAADSMVDTRVAPVDEAENGDRRKVRLHSMWHPSPGAIRGSGCTEALA